jgi:ATP-dependent Clp protease protease subunit
MQYIQSPVHTIALGEAASCAAVLLACGSKGHRSALPNSQIMIHQPWAGGIGGQITDISIQVEQLEKDKVRLLEILARHSGQFYDKIKQDCERDKYISAQEALKYGLVDNIFVPKKQIPKLKKRVKSKSKPKPK